MGGAQAQLYGHTRIVADGAGPKAEGWTLYLFSGGPQLRNLTDPGENYLQRITRSWITEAE
jgi:hypothetical protein